MEKMFNTLSRIFLGLLKLPLLLLKVVLIILFFPIYSAVRAINPKELHLEIKSGGKIWKVFITRLFSLAFILLIVFPIWGFVYTIGQQILLRELGFAKEQVLVSGTGSMYPTFPKGEGKTPEELSWQVVSAPGMFPYPNGFVFRGVRYWGYTLQRGDIVVVENDDIRKITEEIYGDPSGWVKRIIGLPGDTIELRDGLVYLNKEPIREQYTASAHSTFGQSFLSECKEVQVPDNSIFVMGDNRKGSGDSREIGFISIDSVNHVLPLSSQIGSLDSNWRSTDNDLDDSSKIKINKLEYLDNLNNKRREMGVPELKYQNKLQNSAQKRASVILKFDDFSFEATRSGYTMREAMRDSNYSNIVYGEVPRQGYYDAVELIENQFEFPNSKRFLLEPDFDELGIAEVEGEINNCPTQIIVLHFGGYVPPNYTDEQIQNWRDSLRSLHEIQPGWQKLNEYPDFYNKHKTEIDRLNQIIAIRISNTQIIIAKMEANQWFTQVENEILTVEANLIKEQEELATKINGFIKSY